MDLFPCFATQTPLPEATKAAAVLILGVLIESPPVPHMSTIGELCFGVRRTERSLTARTRNWISLGVSFFMVRAIKNAAIDATDSCPLEIKSTDVSISSCVNSFRDISFLMYG
jgi:hypothetical protein